MLITALGLWVASTVVPGMEIRGLGTLLGSAVLLGFVNALVRPLVVLLTLPITILTLGIFLLVINAGMLGLVASLFGGFTLQGFGSAVFGSVIAFTSFVYVLRLLPLQVGMTYAYANPVIAVLLGWLVLAEPVTMWTVGGAGLVLAGIAGVFDNR